MNESWRAIRDRVIARANGCCEYCQTCERITGQPMHVEHIIPGGGDMLENLCLSCANCNLSKAKATTADDPQTGENVALFNPRRQIWREHFIWADDGLRLEGVTPTGRATVLRLRINQERVVTARQWWIESGLHPPNFSVGQ